MDNRSPRQIRVGVATADITPPLGTHLSGSGMGDHRPAREVLDPLHARAIVFASGDRRVAIVTLDITIVTADYTARIRAAISDATGIPPDAIMVHAIQTHSAPSLGYFMLDPDFPLETTPETEYLRGCERAYADFAADAAARAAIRAAETLQPVRLGLGRGIVGDQAFNRRGVRRDGAIIMPKPLGRAVQPLGITELCYLEGPIDPEVGVIALRRASDHAPLGCLVNFACHPTHHGGGNDFSGGYPAALCAELQAGGWPEALFLNGACGNVHDADPARGGQGLPPAEIARLLAGDVQACTAGIAYVEDLPLARRTRHISLEFRDLSDAEIRGAVPGAQRFNTNEVYDSLITNLVAKIRREGRQHAELQAFFLGDVALAAVPAEYFVEYGLDIKERTWPRRTLVVSCANGMVGYLPTREAFARGGYETTFYDGTCLAHNAGDRLTRAVIRLVNGHKPAPPADAGPAPQNAAESSE